MTPDPRDSEAADYPPGFTLNQEKILELLTGDRFYSDASAALREVILNAIDAVQRRQEAEGGVSADIKVTFHRDGRKVSVSDNGTGMSRSETGSLFSHVGATAADVQGGTRSVGEFGIGVVSYFLAGDAFELETWDGKDEPLGLRFGKSLLAGGKSQPFRPDRSEQGTTVTIHVSTDEIFELLVNKFPHWCRDVKGLSAVVTPGDLPLEQGGAARPTVVGGLDLPDWVEKAHLTPVSQPDAWEAMTGESTISVLYRGVFVQEFTVRGFWGIDGSIDVDPKHFKPKLNREGFIADQFEDEVKQLLGQVHPRVLEKMADRVEDALQAGLLEDWTVRRWASLWLAIPRQSAYAKATRRWDELFRTAPAFELAVGNQWKPLSFKEILNLEPPLFLVPLREKEMDEVAKAALRLLRNTGRPVLRGLKRDTGWLKHAPNAFGTTADLISQVFADELPEVIALKDGAEKVLSGVQAEVVLYSEPPPLELVRLGPDGPPILRLKDRLVINLETAKGKAIARDTIHMNRGRWAVIGVTAKHSAEHVQGVAKFIRESEVTDEVLGLVKRHYVRGLVK